MICLCFFHSAQIRKAIVDQFGQGQVLPKCELLLRWLHRDKPHGCLEHDIDLKGAKDCSYFTLYIPDAGEKSVTVNILCKICKYQCVDTLPAEDMATPSPVATDSVLLSPNIGNTTSSPRGMSAIYKILKYEKSTKVPEILPCKNHSHVALDRRTLQ